MTGLRSVLPTGYRPLPFSCFASACVHLFAWRSACDLCKNITFFFLCQLKRHQMIAVPTWLNNQSYHMIVKYECLLVHSISKMLHTAFTNGYFLFSGWDTLKVISRGEVDKLGSDTEEWVMTSVVIVDGGGNILEYVTGDEEAQQVKLAHSCSNCNLSMN